MGVEVECTMVVVAMIGCTTRGAGLGIYSVVVIDTDSGLGYVWRSFVHGVPESAGRA